MPELSGHRKPPSPLEFGPGWSRLTPVQEQRFRATGGNRAMLRRLLSTYGATLLAHLLAFTALIASVRILGNEANGRLVFAYYLAATTVSLAILGQRSGHIYFTARGDVTKIAALSNALVYALLVGSLAASVVLVLNAAYPFGPWHLIPASGLSMLCVAVPLILLRELSLAIARALGKYAAFNASRPLVEASRLVVIIVIGSGLGGGVQSVIVAAFAAEAFWAAVLAVSVWAEGPCGFAPSWGVFKTTQSFSSPAAAVVALSMLHRNIDKFLIPWLMTDGAASLTRYHIALVALSPLNLLTGAISAVVFPTLAGVGEKEAASGTAQLVRTVLAVVLAVAALLTLLAWPLLPIFFGSDNQAAYWPMLLLVPGVAALVVTTCLTSYLSSRREFRFWIGVGIVSLVANVLLNWALIPRYGVQGVAVATSATYLLEAVGLCVHVARRTEVAISDLLFLKMSDLRELRGRLRASVG